MKPGETMRRIRWRAWVEPSETTGPSKRWRPKRDQPAAVVTVVTDRRGRWKFALLWELIGEAVVGEYLTARTQAGMRLARAYVGSHRAATNPGFTERIRVLHPEQFGRKLTNLCYRSGWPLVGLNLPSLLTRLAANAAPARKPKQGPRHVFVLSLPGCGAESRKEACRWRDSFFRPRLIMDPRGPGLSGAFFRWETPRDVRSRRFDGDHPRRGRFVDVAVVAGALAGDDVEAPRWVAALFGVEWPSDRKSGIGRLRAEMTSVVEIYIAERRLLTAVGVAPWRAWSTGSLVVASLDGTGAVPPSAKLDVAPELLAAMTAAMLGGDTSYRLTHEVVPTVLVDRNGDYARCYSALGLQRLITCGRISWEPVDPAWLRQQVSTLEPDLGALGLTFALARFRGENASARVEVRPGSAEFAIRTAPLDFDGPWPCHALDLATAWASCGQVPEVERAWRLVLEGENDDLGPLVLPTGREVDLEREDLALVVLQERLRVESDIGLPNHERERLASCLKLWGNAVCFGLWARHDPDQLSAPVQVSFLDLFGRRRGICTDQPELPARWTFMPGAAAVSACSRFLTARLIARIEMAGGEWVATAVDSVAAVAAPSEKLIDVPGGPVLALSFDVLQRLLADDDRYLGVSAGEPTVWKAEANGFQKPTLAYCAGSNKLLLLRLQRGRLQVVRSCDTALGGHVADPTGRGDRRLHDGRHQWPMKLLEPLAEAAQGFHDRTGWTPLRLPAWAERPVVRRLRVTSAAQLRRLRRIFPETDVRPWDWYLRAEAGEPGDERVVYSLAANVQPRRWLALDWRLRGGGRVEVSTDLLHPPGVLRLRTVEEHLIGWRLGHSVDAEYLALGDQGDWPWPRRGLRSPAGVRSRLSLAELCGRDGPVLDLAEFEPDADLSHVVATYGPVVAQSCAWPGCEETVASGRGTKSRWCPAHRKRSGRDRSTVGVRPLSGCETCGLVLARVNRRFCDDCAAEQRRDRDRAWRAARRACAGEEPP